jgi:hypothetical protein
MAMIERRKNFGDLKACPYPGCPFIGYDHEVDDHRVAAHSHTDEKQEGSNQ